METGSRRPLAAPFWPKLACAINRKQAIRATQVRPLCEQRVTNSRNRRLRCPRRLSLIDAQRRIRRCQVGRRMPLASRISCSVISMPPSYRIRRRLSPKAEGSSATTATRRPIGAANPARPGRRPPRAPQAAAGWPATYQQTPGQLGANDA